jgi:hypothetical protein
MFAVLLGYAWVGRTSHLMLAKSPVLPDLGKIPHLGGGMTFLWDFFYRLLCSKRVFFSYISTKYLGKIIMLLMGESMEIFWGNFHKQIWQHWRKHVQIQLVCSTLTRIVQLIIYWMVRAKSADRPLISFCLLGRAQAGNPSSDYKTNSLPASRDIFGFGRRGGH